MNNFSFYNPTRIFFGAGEFGKLGSLAAGYGKKALLVKTIGPLEKLGVYAKASKLMQDAGMTVYELDGVTSNPRITKVEEGIKICREKGIEIVIAVGGGSGIDTAKAIAFGALDEGDIWDFFAMKREAKTSLPVGVVSTIAATGSEMNSNSVVTNDRDPDSRNWVKWATHFEHSFPRFAILDPELQKTVPKSVTAAGMVDTISHIAEPYFDSCSDTPLQDRLGEGVVLTVIENEKVLEDPENLVYRANLCWAATLALNGLHSAGRTPKPGDAHTLEHEVGAKTDCSHGAGLAVLQPAWLYHICRKNPARFAQFAQRVFGIEKKEGMNDLDVGIKGIDALKAKFKSWGTPSSLKELGVTMEMLPRLVDDILKNPEGKNLNRNDLFEVLESCYE